MMNLKNYIIESLFDIDDNIDKIDKDIEKQIRKFLYNNFTNFSKCKISRKPNSNGKYEISTVGDIEVKNKSITSFTNGMFIWTNIKGNFDCANCYSITSLEGAPKEVEGSFFCNHCRSLISLRGAPEKISRGFHCSFCNSLKSLEGAPKEVRGDFNCFNCDSLISLEGAPEKIGWIFNCHHCNSLISLKGAPKEVGGSFRCGRCKVKFTEEDVKKVSNVKGMIKV